MASASLSFFLQPVKKERTPITIRKYVMRFMPFSSFLPITHPVDNHHVEDGEDGKGITKRAVDDVPKGENLFGAGQEKYSLGQGCLSARGYNGLFQLRLAGPQDPQK